MSRETITTLAKQIRRIRTAHKSSPRVALLLADVLKATAQKGMRAELARELKVTPQRLNQWLSGCYEPGGEISLHLRELFPREADQQKKTPGALETRPAKEPAKKANRHEKQPRKPRKK